MREAQFLKARVSPDVKARVQQAARQQLITESIWLRRSVDAALRSEPSDRLDIPLRSERVAFRSRVYVRLTPEDRLLLKERAAARGMATATYVSVLVRAHLRSLTPLPRDELRTLKRTVAELGAIGRNINQIAHAANSGARYEMPGRDHLIGMPKICTALRDHVKALLKANIESWESGYVEDKRRNQAD